MRYASKADLLAAIRHEYAALHEQLRGIPKSRCTEPGVWGDGWTVADLLAHLAEWQRMCLGWHAAGLKGEKPVMPAPGFTWAETPKLNHAIQAKYHDHPMAEIVADLEDGHQQIVKLVRRLREASLLEPGHFAWTGKNPLTTYLGANSASHYRFATKVLKRWRAVNSR